MDNDLALRARARLAIHKSLWLLSDPNVGMLDFGFPERDDGLCTDEVTIRAHVNRKYGRSGGISLEAAVAEGRTQVDLSGMQIDGFKIDVIEGRYLPHLWNWRQPQQNSQRARRLDPMVGGISISDANHNSYGTLGGKVIDRASGREMILSNWHVLVGSWTARPGLRIYQPGRLDGGTSSDMVAELTRHAMAAGIDAAVATLTGRRELINDQLGIGPVTGVDLAFPGMRVTKSGRASERTSGIVDAVDGVASIPYTGGITRMIRHVVTIVPARGLGDVSRPGDSGSFWLSEGSNRAIGLHFAGSDLPERALAIDMQQVLDALGVDLVTRAAAEIRAAPTGTAWPGFTPAPPITPPVRPAQPPSPMRPSFPWQSREFYEPEPDEMPMSTYSNGNGRHHDDEAYP